MDGLSKPNSDPKARIDLGIEKPSLFDVSLERR